jgi:hypothetical protein
MDMNDFIAWTLRNFADRKLKCEIYHLCLNAMTLPSDKELDGLSEVDF